MLVIGAGVQGLTTGIVLAEDGWPVRIRTADRPQDTTSSVAGAMWGPTMLNPTDRVEYWGTLTHAELMMLAGDESSGVHLAAGTMAARFDLGDTVPPETRLMPDMRRCEPAELPGGFISGYHATLPLIDMPRYLDYLVDRFTGAGGQLLISPVPSLADAADEARIVVNCTGVGARELVGDPAVRPVQGQHVVVRNPGISEFFVELTTGEQWASFMPHGDRVVLGGTAVEHNWSRVPDPETTAGIIRRCAAVEPRLANPVIQAELVGLRPGRPVIRLETEDYAGARIVHNYGHAGGGVSLSWGCAFEAAGLVQQSAA